MEYNEFELDKTRLSYKVEPMIESAKALTSPMSMPSYFGVIIRHYRKRELRVGTDDGRFLPADQREILVGLDSIVVDSSLFSFKDMFIHQSVRRALSKAHVSRRLWGSISDAVMVEGIRMGRANLEACKGRSSKSPVRVYDTLSVCIVTFESFVCYEGVGEC